jgi:hypothetical protein
LGLGVLGVFAGTKRTDIRVEVTDIPASIPWVDRPFEHYVYFTVMPILRAARLSSRLLSIRVGYHDGSGRLSAILTVAFERGAAGEDGEIVWVVGASFDKSTLAFVPMVDPVTVVHRDSGSVSMIVTWPKQGQLEVGSAIDIVERPTLAALFIRLPFSDAKNALRSAIP